MTRGRPGLVGVAALGALALGCLERNGLMVNPAAHPRGTGGAPVAGADPDRAGGRGGEGGAAGEGGQGGEGGEAGEGGAGDAGAGATEADGGGVQPGGGQPADAGPGPDIAASTVPDDRLASKASCPEDPALLLCLRFEKALLDESAPSAQLSGEPLVYEAGPTGMAVRGGAETLVRADSGVGSVGKAFTAEAWLRVDRFPAAGQRAGVIDKQLHFGLFVLPGGDVACSAYGATATAKGVVVLGEWLSAACSAEGNTLKVWINGISRDEAGYLLPLTLGPESVSIGCNQPKGDPLYGLIDNVRVWSRGGPAPPH
jgi:hypothetical protein